MQMSVVERAFHKPLFIYFVNKTKLLHLCLVRVIFCFLYNFQKPREGNFTSEIGQQGIYLFL